MKVDREINTLFSSLKKAIRRHGIETVNKELEIISGSNKEVDAVAIQVLKTVSSIYSVPLQKLINSSQRGETQIARRAAVCYLYFNMNLTVRYISLQVFGKNNHTFVQASITKHRGLDEKIKDDKEYLDKFKQIENKLNKKIKYGSK